MCGIAGSVNFKLPYDTIDAVMHHRGPDEQNGFSSGNVDFFHLRLAIQDIKCGKQPMTLNDRYTIMFNGEIYNHQELRKQHNLAGNTQSDTETLLLLYRKYGKQMLHHLDGMFVMAIYDNEERKLFIARDRAGKKPLYIFDDGQKIVFASELNCLKTIIPLELKLDNFYHYTRLGVFYRELTPYKNVRELLAGSYIEIDCGTRACKEERWWNIHEYYLKPLKDDLDTSATNVDRYLHMAVKRRLESSDLEVGCFLSGGIDSGLVTSIATNYNNKLKTFTVSFGGEYNEAPLARLVAEKYETQHTEINISFDHLRDDVEGIIANYGEPFFDSSAIPSFYVSREARKYVTVILNGDGADELFGGYRRYVPFSKADFFRNAPLTRNSAKLIRQLLPMPHNKKSKYNFLYRLLSLSSRSGVEVYLSAGLDIIEDYEQYVVGAGSEYMAPLRRDFETIASSSLSGLKKIMNMDFDTNLFSDLLVKMDIATMANSLEGRSPFLSKELLEYAPGLDDKYKINGSTTKYLLRTLAKKYLPAQLVNQPKRGFEIPLKNWVNGELKEMIHDYLKPGAFCNNVVQSSFTQKLLANKIRIPAEKRAKIIWMLFCLEVWHKKVYAG
jgi:asparagine synthase (glutamine-hydrolysing)